MRQGSASLLLDLVQFGDPILPLCRPAASTTRDAAFDYRANTEHISIREARFWGPDFGSVGPLLASAIFADNLDYVK